MRFPFILSLVLSLAIPTSASFAYIESNRSEFKGHVAITNIIKTRLLLPNSKFNLSFYLGSDPNFPDELMALLGSYTSGTIPFRFKNGKPNGLNMLLWYLVLNGFSKDVAQICGLANNPNAPVLFPKFNPPFLKAVSALCSWPSSDTKKDDVLYNLWLAVESFDPPYSEYEAWKTFFLTSDYSKRPATETLSAMMLAMLMNPHFLLR